MQAEQTTSHRLQLQREHQQSMRMKLKLCIYGITDRPRMKTRQRASHRIRARDVLPLLIVYLHERFSELPVNMSAWITVVSGRARNRAAAPIE